MEGEDAAVLLGASRATSSPRAETSSRSSPRRTLPVASPSRGTRAPALGVLLHAVEHMAYHTGQIVYVAKQLVGDRAEIEFYPHLK